MNMFIFLEIAPSNNTEGYWKPLKHTLYQILQFLITSNPYITRQIQFAGCAGQHCLYDNSRMVQQYITSIDRLFLNWHVDNSGLPNLQSGPAVVVMLGFWRIGLVNNSYVKNHPPH